MRLGRSSIDKKENIVSGRHRVMGFCRREVRRVDRFARLAISLKRLKRLSWWVDAKNSVPRGNEWRFEARANASFSTLLLIFPPYEVFNEIVDYRSVRTMSQRYRLFPIFERSEEFDVSARILRLRKRTRTNKKLFQVAIGFSAGKTNRYF